MDTILGTYRNGQVVLDAPADWPDGVRVVVQQAVDKEALSVREPHWPDSPEAITRHLELMDKMEPLEMTPEEWADWEAARKAQKEFEIANWGKWNREIEDLFR